MRCKRCRTYINPYVGWLSNGRQWRCNVCGMVNDTPASYHCHLDQNGQRSDKAERPELGQASVELVRELVLEKCNEQDSHHKLPVLGQAIIL